MISNVGRVACMHPIIVMELGTVVCGKEHILMLILVWCFWTSLCMFYFHVFVERSVSNTLYYLL